MLEGLLPWVEAAGTGRGVLVVARHSDRLEGPGVERRMVLVEVLVAHHIDLVEVHEEVRHSHHTGPEEGPAVRRSRFVGGYRRNAGLAEAHRSLVGELQLTLVSLVLEEAGRIGYAHELRSLVDDELQAW